MLSSPRLQQCHYLELADSEFFSPVQPRPVSNPQLLHLNHRLLTELGLQKEEFSPESFSNRFAEPELPSSLQPLAMAYSGHQFGQFNPTLGDGRAMRLTDLIDPEGNIIEIQLKGSGPTPYSRGFDGRAVLRSVIREYLASEAIAALGIPSTRALCILSSDTRVYREQPESAALMLRTAPSHLRFGSFEHFYARGQLDLLRQLADFCISHHFPTLNNHPQRYDAWFAAIVRRTARLMAQWQAVGFCHGVMNTDNFSILGLTLDYGPYGFMERYDPQHVCNQSDHEGRYRFERQPGIGYWNCLCLARALSPLLDQKMLEQALAEYETVLQQSYLTQMQLKLGLTAENTGSEQRAADETLIAKLLLLLTQQELDYSRFFRGLSYWLDNNQEREWLYQEGDPEAIDHWLDHYQQRLKQQDMPLTAKRSALMAKRNPKYILRNHLAQEAIIQAQQGNNEELDRLLYLLQNPFDEHPEYQHYAEGAPADTQPISVSCSS